MSEDEAKAQAAQKKAAGVFEYHYPGVAHCHTSLAACRRAYRGSKVDGGNRKELKCQIIKLQVMAARKESFSRVAFVCLEPEAKDFLLQKVEQVTEFMPVQNACKGKNKRVEAFFGAIIRLPGTGDHMAVPHNRFVSPIPAHLYETAGDISKLPKSVTVLIGPFEGKYLTRIHASPPRNDWIEGDRLYLEAKPMMSMAAFEMFSNGLLQHPHPGLPRFSSVKTSLDATSIGFEDEAAFASPPVEEGTPEPAVKAASVPDPFSAETDDQAEISAPPRKKQRRIRSSANWCLQTECARVAPS